MKHLYDMKYLLRKYEVNAEKNKCADKACFMRQDRYSFLNALKARLIKKVLPYFGKNFFGWGGGIRTHEMQESKSCALPLGDTPMLSYRKNAHSL